MIEDTSTTGGARPSRRTALKTLGGAVAAGGAVMAGSAVASPPAAAHGHRTARIPDGLKPGGALDQLAADLAAKDQWSGSLLVTHRGRTVLSRSHGSAEEAFDGTLEYIRRAGSDLAFEPGIRNSYSNTGYFLLGAIVAAVSNRSYFDYVAERVFKAAGMHDSAFHTKPQWRADPRLAHPYYKKEGQTEWTDGLEEQGYIGLPPGGSFATCADLERFAHVLLENRLMKAPCTRLMLGAKLPPIAEETRSGGDAPERSPLRFLGYGSLATLDHGQWIHGHGGGSTIGTSANIDIFPDSDWVVVVLSGYADKASNPLATLARKLIVEE